MTAADQDQRALEKCLKLIEENLAWGPVDNWHNDAFTELSEIIEKSTGVLLSPTTLKRVWGKVQYSHKPSITTLNTLSRFAGFANWRSLKNDHTSRQDLQLFWRLPKNVYIYLLSGALLFISVFSLFTLTGSGRSQPVKTDYSSIHFSSQPVTLGLPNTVVFQLNLAHISSDSIFIQQYWDPTKTIAVRPGQEQATGIYYLPGYFRAELHIDDQIAKKHDLFIRSNGWLGTLNFQPIPKYFEENEILNDGLSFPQVAAAEVIRETQPMTTSFHLVDSLNIAADNLTLSTSIKNIYRDKWAVCQSSRIILLGTEGAMIVPFSIPGCVSDLGLMLNDKYLSGKEHDLSAFGSDFSTYRNIDIEIRDKTTTIFIDGKKIFTDTYGQTMGQLAGIRFNFLGVGEVGHLEIDDHHGFAILNERFLTGD